MKNVVLITNIPNPYRVPLFNELARQLSEQNWNLTIIFGSKGYSRRKFDLDDSSFQFKSIYLDSTSIQVGSDNEKTTFTYKGLWKSVKSAQPDVIITNGFSPATTKVWFHSLSRKIPYIIWSGAVLAPGRFDSFTRKMHRKLMMRSASGFIAYGSAAREYLEKLGSGNKPIDIAINTVDTSFFSEETEKLRKTKSDDSVIHLTFTGYLVKRKRVDKLLECIALLAKTRNDFVLDILGDGEDRQHLEQFCETHQLKDRVKFHGFVQKNELPGYLAHSNVFLFQTDFDIWGLVLNEAMAAGLPVIASTFAGASRDLIREGETGFVVDFGNTSLAADKINQLLDNRELAQRMGKSASSYIREHASLEKSARGFVSAILKTGANL